MGRGKFEVLAGKHCWKLADRLSVLVYSLGQLGLRCWFADWRIRDVMTEVVSCSAAAAPASPMGARRTASGTQS